MIEASKDGALSRTLSYGMVGGGGGAFIGDVHRKSAAFDGRCRLVAGCFSRDHANTVETGQKLGLAQDRLYVDFKEMARAESKRDDGIDFVSIVTPNSSHFEIARAFLKAGINVVCEKPLCLNVAQAKELKSLAQQKDLLFLVTYVYSGYPLVEEARNMVRSGMIGDIRTIMGEYPQDWLASLTEETDNRQAKWRTDPVLSGASNCVGDIGSHIENTVSYITGLRITKLCARLERIPGTRLLDTNAHILVEYDNGASGAYWSSQIAAGHENGLRVRIYGEKGSIEWSQEEPNSLKVSMLGEPARIYTRGQGYLTDGAKGLTRLPPGHPEGYFEAFANLYTKFADAIMLKKRGKDPGGIVFTDVNDGYNGVEFINKCVRSSAAGSKWISVSQI